MQQYASVTELNEVCGEPQSQAAGFHELTDRIWQKFNDGNLRVLLITKFAVVYVDDVQCESKKIPPPVF